MPWGSFGSLIIVLLCSAGSFLILHFSNGVSATKWPDLVAPNVCLSILSSVSGIATTYAIGEGIAIAWWRRAVKSARVKELHNAWSFSDSTTSIFTKVKYFNVIALAALMTKISVIDGILYQRAMSTFINVDWHPTPARVQAWVKDYFPTTAIMGFANPDDFSLTTSSANIVWVWYQSGNGPFFDDRDVQGCDGIGCAYNLAGMGFSFDCEHVEYNDNFVNTAPANSNQTQLTLFSIDVSMKYPDVAKNYSRLQYTMVYPSPRLDGSANHASCPHQLHDYNLRSTPGCTQLHYVVHPRE